MKAKIKEEIEGQNGRTIKISNFATEHVPEDVDITFKVTGNHPSGETVTAKKTVQVIEYAKVSVDITETEFFINAEDGFTFSPKIYYPECIDQTRKEFTHKEKIYCRLGDE